MPWIHKEFGTSYNAIIEAVRGVVDDEVKINCRSVISNTSYYEKKERIIK